MRFEKSEFTVKTNPKRCKDGLFVDEITRESGVLLSINNVKMQSKSKATAYLSVLTKFSSGLSYDVALKKNGNDWMITKKNVYCRF